jgi:hypothetical protein
MGLGVKERERESKFGVGSFPLAVLRSNSKRKTANS